KEEHAIINKSVAKRQSKLTPQALASDVFALIENEHPALLKVYRDLAHLDGDVPTEGLRIPGQGKPEIINDLLMTGVRFKGVKGSGGEIARTRSAEQAKLVAKIFELGGGGRSYFLPIEKDVIERQIRRIDDHLKARRAKAKELIEARTSDAEIGRKALDMVLARL
ncbi:MAG: hypothetical protein WBF43_12465, partial [Methylocella sp.]